MEGNPAALRIMRIRGLLVGLNALGLADRICDVFGVDHDDMTLLLDIEEVLKELNPTQTKDESHG